MLLDLFKLNPKPTNFYLLIQSPQMMDPPVPTPSRQIPSAVYSRVRL